MVINESPLLKKYIIAWFVIKNIFNLNKLMSMIFEIFGFWTPIQGSELPKRNINSDWPQTNVFTSLDVSDQKEHILFFTKNNILLSTGPGCFALGPGPREYHTYRGGAHLKNFLCYEYCCPAWFAPYYRTQCRAA